MKEEKALPAVVVLRETILPRGGNGVYVAVRSTAALTCGGC